MNRFSVEGKKIFLTGASGWLGSAMASALTEEGATVYSPARNEFTRDGFLRYNEFGPFDVIVNNAHPMNWSRDPLGNVAPHLEALNWPFWSIQILRKAQSCSVINIASMYGLVAPNPKLYEETDSLNPIGYGMAKAGMLALTRYVASFWGRQGIRCNAICPGAFPKPSVATDFQQRLADRTVLGRVGKPEDLIGAVLYLASDASSYMTGQTLVIDGGWTIT